MTVVGCTNSKIAGIAPDSKQATDQSENIEQEQKLVKEALVSAYDKNISVRLKAELCSFDVSNYNYAKDGSKSKFLSSLLFFLH
jgi:hypothetical protein